MWTYVQGTGKIGQDGMLLATGYAGCGEGKNNPAMQDCLGQGPLPRGKYLMEAPVDTKTHGLYVMWLAPWPGNAMYGRGGFGIHGDSVLAPGTASEGCIVLPRTVRERIWNSGDHELTVV